MYITWETYQCGNVLSLIVSCGWGFDMNTHSVYLYDTATGEQMTTAQLLETLQVEPETFLAAVRQAAAERFDGKYAGIGGDTDELVGMDAVRREYQSGCDDLRGCGGKSLRLSAHRVHRRCGVL